MRRLALLAVCSVVALVFGAVPASADNGPHVAGAGALADGCAGCHRVHTAKTDMLTKETQPQLCYTCHDNTGTGATTDVVDGVSRGATPGALRGGGFEYALIDSGNADDTVPALDVSTAGSPATKTTSSHSVDGTDGVAWGNGPISATANAGSTIQLRCGSCHDPHGNGNYRILRPMPTQSGALDPGVAIPETPNTTKDYTTSNYWNAADGNEPKFIANVAAWCSTCHTRYLVNSDGPVEPSADAIFQLRHFSNARGAGGPSCIKCHVSHGSNASMGAASNTVPFPTGDVAHPDATNGNLAMVGNSSRLLRVDNRGTCQMCHEH
jgi:predicted CXXCH cytochrome family protein